MQDVKAIWAENHLLLIPSINEGLPLVLTEDMICGRPAVITDVGGMADLISEPVTRFVSPNTSVIYFGQALERAGAKQANWQEMGQNAQNFARMHFDFGPEATLLDKIVYKNLTEIS